MKRLSLTVAVALSLAFGSSASADMPFLGVSFTDAFAPTATGSTEYCVYDIDPTAPGISFKVTDSNGALPGDTNLQTTKDFVTQQNAQIGINASYYSIVTGTTPANSFADLGSLVAFASGGNVYRNNSDSGAQAMNIKADNSVSFLDQAHSASDLYNTITGTNRLVSNSTNLFASDTTTLRASRTALGVRADGHILLLVVQGLSTSPANTSTGMTIKEVGQLMVTLGAKDAILNLGGGESTLVQNDSANGVHFINNPVSTAGISQGPNGRAVGSNLVFARLRRPGTRAESASA